jgi:hypothetical protein
MLADLDWEDDAGWEDEETSGDDAASDDGDKKESGSDGGENDNGGGADKDSDKDGDDGGSSATDASSDETDEPAGAGGDGKPEFDDTSLTSVHTVVLRPDFGEEPSTPAAPDSTATGTTNPEPVALVSNHGSGPEDGTGDGQLQEPVRTASSAHPDAVAPALAAGPSTLVLVVSTLGICGLLFALLGSVLNGWFERLLF